MKFTLTTVIALPPHRVYDLLTSREGLQCMVPNYIDSEPLAGTPGQPGATTRLNFRTGNDRLTLIETIVDRSPPKLIANTYDLDAVLFSLIHQLAPTAAESTHWTCEVSSDVNRGGWLANWLFSVSLRAAGRKAMALLKARAESAP